MSMHECAAAEQARTALAHARKADSPDTFLDALKAAVRFEKEIDSQLADAYKAVFVILTTLSNNQGVLALNRVDECERQIRSTLNQVVNNLDKPYRDTVHAASLNGAEQAEEDAKKIALIFTALAFLSTHQAVIDATSAVLQHGSRGFPFSDFAQRAAIDSSQNIAGMLRRAAITQSPVLTLRKAISEELNGKGRSMGYRLKSSASQDVSAVYSITQLQYARMHKNVVKVRWMLNDLLHTVKDVCDEYANRDYSPDDPKLRNFPPHIGCVLGNTEIQPIGLLHGFSAWYDGEAIECVTQSGKRLSVSENHLILTQRGFVRARDLREGDYLVSRNRKQWMLSIGEHINHKPSMSAEVIHAALKARSMGAVQVPVSSHDFHGDGARLDRKVDIVSANGFLRSYGLAPFSQPIAKNDLRFALPMGKVSLPGLRDQRSLLQSVAFAADCVMGGRGDAYAIRTRGFGIPFSHPLGSGAEHRAYANQLFFHPHAIDSEFLPEFKATQSGVVQDFQFHRGRNRPGLIPTSHKAHGFHVKWYTSIEQEPPHPRGGNTSEFCGLVERCSGLIFFDRLVDARRFTHNGPVYDFQTDSTVCISNDVLSSNCYCRLMITTI